MPTKIDHKGNNLVAPSARDLINMMERTFRDNQLLISQNSTSPHWISPALIFRGDSKNAAFTAFKSTSAQAAFPFQQRILCIH